MYEQGGLIVTSPLPEKVLFSSRKHFDLSADLKRDITWDVLIMIM